MGSISVESSVENGSKEMNSKNKYLRRSDFNDLTVLHTERVPLQIQNFTINGFKSQQSAVANFRNVQYARIPARWRQAVPVDPTKEVGTIDATQWGPRCPQPVDVLHDATHHLYPRMSTFDYQSEFECLNLNVYCPVSGLGSKLRGYPVLVWIHGGAFVFGDGGCEFDGQYLVRHSIDLGKPVVVVGINYRLGVLGVFASREVQTEARTNGDVGFNNLGLHDQRIALQWVQQNIHYFGGDGSRITVAGESAGACSILAHLRGQVPVFQNAFLMSAASVMPAPFSEAQEIYDHLVSTIRLENAPAGIQLSCLRSMSPQEIVSIIGGKQGMMIEDSEFFSNYSGERFDQLSVIPSWIKAIVIGQTKHENVLFAQKWHKMSADEIYSRWDSLYEDRAYAQEVFSAYGISRMSPHSDMITAIIAYTGDVLFGTITNSIATEHLQKPHKANPKVYHYSFDQPDIMSTNEVFRGGAYHSLDNAFLFRHPQVAGFEAPAEFRATADVYSGAAIDLVNGEEPWEDVSVARRWMSIFAEFSTMKGEPNGSALRWSHLVNTSQRYSHFLLGKTLLFEAMAYALSLPIDIHRE